MDPSRASDQYGGASVRRGDTGAWRCGHSLLGRNISGSFLFFPLFLGKMIGTGDIKVLAVLGSVLGPRKILFCIVTAFLLGAVESFFLLFFRCDWRQRFLYFFQYLQRAYVERSLPPYLVPGKRPENIHFTIPILGSVLLLYLGG